MKIRCLQIAWSGAAVLLSATAAAAATNAGATASRPSSQASFVQRVASARLAYFHDLEGDASAHEQAREQFSALEKERPGDTVVQAYVGSLDLLDAAHTWAIWSKHALSLQGLHELDDAVERDPTNLEARFIRAATTWHLPFFFHRREQAESDFAYIAPRAAQAVASGQLPPQLGAAALDYYGQSLSDKSDQTAARTAYETAIRIDQSSPAGKDALRRLKQPD